VTLTGDKRISAAFAGDMEQAHLAGCAYVADQVTARCKPADLVISSNGGYPLDQNLYQAVKCLATAEAVCNPGGVIIAAAECCDGHGGEEFSRALAGFSSPGQALAAITGRGREETQPDQWQSQILMRILAAYTVIMVTGPAVPAAVVESLGMRHAADMDIALRLADSLLGEKADKTAAVVIPDGVNIIAAPYSLPTSRNCVGTR
ncbi:MAG: lactate racemization operon protein LarA, partial [Planctomycetes bacterium]|nr:lactate racemization operon protein LarA [Planctomycetota bacterium]